MSDTPCVDGCGQDAATIERLREENRRLRATVARVEALAEALTTAAKIETQGGEHHAAGLIEAIQADLRAVLTPATGPRSGAGAPEAPGQPGRDEGAAGGHMEALAALVEAGVLTEESRDLHDGPLEKVWLTDRIYFSQRAVTGQEHRYVTEWSPDARP